MSARGIVRCLDELGRICIPIETRRTLGIMDRDPVDISVEGNSIVIRKHTDACIFCGDSGELVEYEGSCICAACIKKIGRLGTADE